VRRLALPAWLLAAALASACTARPAPRETRPRRALADAALGAYYAPIGPLPEAKVEPKPKEETRRFRVARVDVPFEAPEGTPEAGRKPIRMTWYEPKGGEGGPRPLVLLSPILGSDTDFVEGFAEAFAERGWHAAIVRRPKIAYDPERPLSQVEDGMRVAVMRQRRALDWFLARDDVDPARVGSFGISAGGILGSIVAAADDRYAAHVLCLAGGPLADVLVDTSEKGLRKLVDRAMEREGMRRAEIRDALFREIRTDPVGLAHRVDPAKVLLFLARFDETVPTRCGRALWRAMGEPEMVMVPLGHYTSVLLLPWVRGRTVDFLEERFAAAARETAPGRSAPR
jgi:dienelactone hydrolase